MKDNKTILTVLIPLFAVNAYTAGALIAKNKEVKRLFTMMSGFATGLLITEVISYFMTKDQED